MIDYIRGKVVKISDSEIVLDYSGLGFRLICPSATLAACQVGEECTLLTHLQIREDARVLFGFSDERQREMFIQLQSVSGIGCKTACGILSGVSAFDLAMAIVAGDAKALSGIKGVGKKTAERIIVELKEKVAMPEGGTESSTSRDIQDAILALTALGFPQSDAVQSVMNVPRVAELSLNEIVAAALRSIK